jgi:SAM domain (Sterile alpha motif)
VATITEWLASLGMSEYAQRFADDRIDDVSIHPARMAASNSSGWEDDRKG